MSIAEDIAVGAGSFFSNITTGLPILAIIITLLAVGFVLFMVIVYFKRKFDFEGTGTPIGHYHIEIMGKYPLVGNLAEWDRLNEDELDLLGQEERFKIVPSVIKQMYKEETLFIYTMKNPDDSDIMDKFGNRTFIISSGNLKSEKYAYESQKGKFTIRNILTKERTMNVVAYSSARKIPIMNEDRNIDDWWVIAPMPIVTPKEMVGFDSRVTDGMTHHIEVKEIVNAKALATILDIAPFVTKALLSNEHLKTELKETNSQLELRTKQLSQANQKLNKKKMQLGQKPYVINGKMETKEKEKQNIMMMIVSVILGGLAVMYMPSFFPNMAVQSAQFIGLVIAIILIGGMAYMQNKQKPVDTNDTVMVNESKTNKRTNRNGYVRGCTTLP